MTTSPPALDTRLPGRLRGAGRGGIVEPGDNHRGDHARPVELKRRCDPGSLFRLNHGIVP